MARPAASEDNFPMWEGTNRKTLAAHSDRQCYPDGLDVE